ncbi:MAG: DUF1653 domain-containing protein [Clostridiales bacterium]|nr:DUF1653 domain-containing protein [Clostridiales bacterium]
MEVIRNEIYRHNKTGNLYIIVDIATHSETKERMVCYRALYGECKLWVRPYKMFIEEINGVPRFEKVEISDKRK